MKQSFAILSAAILSIALHGMTAKEFYASNDNPQKMLEAYSAGTVTLSGTISADSFYYRAQYFAGKITASQLLASLKSLNVDEKTPFPYSRHFSNAVHRKSVSADYELLPGVCTELREINSADSIAAADYVEGIYLWKKRLFSGNWDKLSKPAVSQSVFFATVRWELKHSEVSHAQIYPVLLARMNSVTGSKVNDAAYVDRLFGYLMSVKDATEYAQFKADIQNVLRNVSPKAVGDGDAAKSWAVVIAKMEQAIKY